MVNIEISDFVKKGLDAIKESEGHKSLDSVVRVLLEPRLSQTMRRATTSAKEPENEVTSKLKDSPHGGGIGGERR